LIAPDFLSQLEVLKVALCLIMHVYMAYF
jgi:hypothetical protein